jgi:hypothetical protein
MSTQPNSPSQRTEEDREFAAVKEQDIWEEARDRLQIANEADADNCKRAKDAILFREGDQWEANPNIGEDEIELTINLTDAMVERVENNIRQQRPRGKVHPVGDGADVEIAEVINGIGRHIEVRSEASIAYDTAASQALDGGFGYFRIIAEYLNPRSFQKDLRILPIRNQFTVKMDPAAIMPHGGDQGWCLITTKMKRQEYRRRYPSAENAAWNDLGIDELRRDWDDKEEIRLAEYFRVREKPEKLYLIRGQGGQEFTKYLSEMPRNPATGKLYSIDEAKLWLAAKGFSIDGERDSVKRQVEWFRLNGLKVVERQQLPGTYIPVFRVEGKAKDIGGQVRRRGMVEPMMDAARMVNYGEVAKIKRLGLTPKAPWVAWEGQLDGHPEWDDANLKAYSVLTIKPVIIESSAGPVLLPAPVRQPPAQIEQGFSEFVQGMRSNLMAIAGMPNEPGQDQQGQVVSGKAIQRRQYLSDQSHYQYYDKLTLSIAQCWRVMVEWIPVYFSEERMQRIIGEDSTPQMVKINEQNQDPSDTDENQAVKRVKNDLSVGVYDVVMDTGPGYETKREEGAENLIDLMKVAPLAEIIAKNGPDLVFRSIDHPYMQELADRLMATTPDGLEKIMEGLSGKAKNIVMALQKELQAAQQQNQALQQEVKSGLAKAHLAAVTKAHEIDVTARTKIHDTDSRDRTKLDVAEIGAAGRLMDSEAERRHGSAQAAREMLHAGEQAALDRSFEASESSADRILQQATQDKSPQPTGEQ